MARTSAGMVVIVDRKDLHLARFRLDQHRDALLDAVGFGVTRDEREEISLLRPELERRGARGRPADELAERLPVQPVDAQLFLLQCPGFAALLEIFAVARRQKRLRPLAQERFAGHVPAAPDRHHGQHCDQRRGQPDDPPPPEWNVRITCHCISPSGSPRLSPVPGLKSSDLCRAARAWRGSGGTCRAR